MGYTMAKTVNGVEVDKLNTLVETVKADPNKGKVEFRVETSWVNGAPSKTKIRGFALEADET